mmetsp:Transcript_34190/g.86481  ORF Transcript_34190/g.86481 Transcript_34190/m.86481 type:complete len:82 (-) Transcript_34190:28-273(-)
MVDRSQMQLQSIWQPVELADPHASKLSQARSSQWRYVISFFGVVYSGAILLQASVRGVNPLNSGMSAGKARRSKCSSPLLI